MTDKTANTRRRLGELGVMSERVERDERRILAHAEKLHGEVVSKLDKDRGGALGAGSAGDDYQALVTERGRLERVINEAKRVLG